MNTSVPDPAPLYVGEPGEGLFTWLHRARADRTSSFGVVVCNPFGFEEVCAHQSLRHLAMAVADSGVPALRFDYFGCGNSEGDEQQPMLFEQWVRSVHRAADALRQATGVQRVCLLGVRLGALVATLAASERDDVIGLVAIAPVLRGRAYLRELTMLSATGTSAPPVAAPSADGSLESAGFVLSAQTVGALSAVDLRKLDRAPAPYVLIIDRDDMPGGAAPWVPELQALGADVQLAHWPGYAGMMLDPQRATPPQEIIDGVVGTLASWQPALAFQAAPPQPVGERMQRLQLDGYRLEETVMHVDTGAGQLFGVLTRTEGATAQPAVLMLNSGSVHHIGPNRLWVRLARSWAKRGVTVLRLDISGIGDSPARAGAEENVVYSRHAGADIAAALACLRREVGATHCHAMGLCSGGYHALKAAMSGQYMDSALMVNPLTFNWKEGMQMGDVKDYEVMALASRLRERLFTTGSWWKLLRGRVDVRTVLQVAWRRLHALVDPPALELARALHLPLKDDLARQLADAARHGIRLKFVFAENAPGFDLLERQGGQAIHRMVKRHEASLDFIADADHTFTRRDARDRLVALLDQRMLDEALLA